MSKSKSIKASKTNAKATKFRSIYVENPVPREQVKQNPLKFLKHCNGKGDLANHFKLKSKNFHNCAL